MRRSNQFRFILSKAAVVLAILFVLPAATEAQLGGILPTSGGSTSTITGDAAAVRATILGLSTTLSDTGALTSATTREASQVAGAVSSVLSAETLHAATFGWADQVASEASLSNLNLSGGGLSITADMVMARASQVKGAVGSGSSILSGLSINGVPINVTGLANQVIAIPGGQVILNQQSVSSTGAMVVNAIHVVVTGVADVVIGSATARIS